jgi:hypothetical protein
MVVHFSWEVKLHCTQARSLLTAEHSPHPARKLLKIDNAARRQLLKYPAKIGASTASSEEQPKWMITQS